MNPQITDNARMSRDEIVVRAFRRLYGPLCGYVRKRIGDIDCVEDIVQDIFLSLLSVDRIMTEQSVSKYAYACARNRVTDYMRHHACTLAAVEYFSGMSRENMRDTCDTADYHRFARLESEVLGKAGEKGRAVYMLSVHADMPVKEIARRMEISERTVQNHLFRVREKVRQEFKKII